MQPNAGGGGGGAPQPGGFGGAPTPFQQVTGVPNTYGHPMPYTAANEVRRFHQDIVPGLAERFTALGGGQRSSAFQGALGQAGVGLGLGLGALGEQQQLSQNQQLFNQQMAQREFEENNQRWRTNTELQDSQWRAAHGLPLLQAALSPQSSTTVLPAQSGVVPGLVHAVGGGLGMLAKTAAL